LAGAPPAAAGNEMNSTWLEYLKMYNKLCAAKGPGAEKPTYAEVQAALGAARQEAAEESVECVRVANLLITLWSGTLNEKVVFLAFEKDAVLVPEGMVTFTAAEAKKFGERQLVVESVRQMQGTSDGEPHG